MQNPRLVLTSTAFAHEGEIPREYTCEGRNVPPPFSFADVPANAQSLALIVHDPDVPDPRNPRRIWVHWVLYNLPTTTTGLPAAVSPAQLPAGTRAGENDWHQRGYGGPCPPVGRHRYVHTLYALDVVLPDLRGPTRSALLQAFEGHVVAEARLIGTYEKTR
jgi:Raf kinase inhibitor-like YbhB/YbcL family protein